MKTLLITLLIAFTIYSCKAQQLTTVNLNTYIPGANDKSGKYYKDIDGDFNAFLGVWENTTGNNTFKVELFKAAIPQGNSPFDYSYDTIQGKYYLIENYGTPNETIICTGQNLVREGVVIMASSSDGVSMQGLIFDTCIPIELNSTSGVLKMEITNTNLAHWTITRKGISISGMEYVIPTDIILTKQ